jgi:hypothetical protein
MVSVVLNSRRIRLLTTVMVFAVPDLVFAVPDLVGVPVADLGVPVRKDVAVASINPILTKLYSLI